MGVDHYAVQGALALALVALALTAALWPRGPRGRRYLGLVSGRGLAVASLRLQPRELGGQVVEAERAL
jgi:hypothetical protein